MKIFSKEEKFFNNNLVYKNYESYRNYHPRKILLKIIQLMKKSYSIRNKCRRNYYKNISCGDKNKIRKEIKENKDDKDK